MNNTEIFEILESELKYRKNRIEFLQKENAELKAEVERLKKYIEEKEF